MIENKCYEIAELYSVFYDHPQSMKLDTGLKDLLDTTTASDAKLRLLRLFDDAIEEISMINTLTEDHITRMISQVRGFQTAVFDGLLQVTVENFLVKAQAKQTISTLTLIGHTLSATSITKQKPFNREDFIKSTEAMIDEVSGSSLHEVQREFLKLELRSIIRTMHECHGATDDQIRRRLKSVFADFAAEYEDLDRQQRQFYEKFKDYVSSTMKGGAFVLGLTSESLTVLSIAGPIATTMIEGPEQTKMIEGPTKDIQEDGNS